LIKFDSGLRRQDVRYKHFLLKSWLDDQVLDGSTLAGSSRAARLLPKRC
jgi:hypothetical protein